MIRTPEQQYEQWCELEDALQREDELRRVSGPIALRCGCVLQSYGPGRGRPLGLCRHGFGLWLANRRAQRRLPVLEYLRSEARREWRRHIGSY